jgi:cysteine desulfurase
MQVYLDNAATTPIAPEVIDSILFVLKEDYGNPSSSHGFGRKAKALLENARRTIAKTIHCSPSEIIFTAGGTEADNMALRCAVEQLDVKHIITSQIEHHAVLHTVEYLQKHFDLELSYVATDSKGNIDLRNLAELLKSDKKTLVSLMHANNEIGTYLPIHEVSRLCRQNNALFHSDTVQSIGHIPLNLSELDIDFITCSAHKLHGPKGVGFLYANKQNRIQAFIQGGSQERGLRSGTENTAGIIGMAKALELMTLDLDVKINAVWELKKQMLESLQVGILGVMFNGETSLEKSLYTVLNCSFPSSKNDGMLLFSLDLKGIACSGGSACTSGANTGSHVLRGINSDSTRQSIRFSFSHYTTKEEIEFTVNVLIDMFNN